MGSTSVELPRDDQLPGREWHRDTGFIEPSESLVADRRANSVAIRMLVPEPELQVHGRVTQGGDPGSWCLWYVEDSIDEGGGLREQPLGRIEVRPKGHAERERRPSHAFVSGAVHERITEHVDVGDVRELPVAGSDDDGAHVRRLDVADVTRRLDAVAGPIGPPRVLRGNGAGPIT